MQPALLLTGQTSPPHGGGPFALFPIRGTLAERRRATCYAREATTDEAAPGEEKKGTREYKKGGEGGGGSAPRQREIRREREIYCSGAHGFIPRVAKDYAC
jgi:hypothetical protein